MVLMFGLRLCWHRWAWTRITSLGDRDGYCRKCGGEKHVRRGLADAAGVLMEDNLVKPEGT